MASDAQIAVRGRTIALEGGAASRPDDPVWPRRAFVLLLPIAG
jgi:hypothetical protein